MWAALAKAKSDIHLKTDDTYSRPGGFTSKPVDVIIKEGEPITVTHGRNEKYALWGYGWIWDISEDCVGEIITIYSER